MKIKARHTYYSLICQTLFTKRFQPSGLHQGGHPIREISLQVATLMKFDKLEKSCVMCFVIHEFVQRPTLVCTSPCVHSQKKENVKFIS